MRLIKISGLFQRRRWAGVFVPQIRLQGIYLRNAGFAPGDAVQVTIENGKIIITKQ